MSWYKYTTSKWAPRNDASTWSYIQGPTPKEMKAIFGGTEEGAFVSFFDSKGIINEYDKYFIVWCFVPRPPLRVLKLHLERTQRLVRKYEADVIDLQHQIRKRKKNA